MRNVFTWLLGATLAAGAAMAATTAAQEKPKTKEKPAQKVYVDPAWKPMTISAAAMRFGAELEENASEEMKRWVKEQVKKQLRNSPVEPKTAMALADERFAAASEEARDAVTYLLYYSASQDEDENQRLLAARIRDIDRDTVEITRQMQVIWKNEQVRSVSPNQPVSQEQRVAQEQEIQRMEAQLRELAQERQFKGTELNASRKKLNAYLKLLTMVHPRMEGIQASVVRGMQ
ncbi:MAG: hypothetical protein M1451_10510 [Acidobacteria bacterium]|nr:hypothetical protein [Acidobacteriota bacterium]